MAVDEAIFKAVSAGTSLPTLRFYTWEPSAVSVGYFQNSLGEVDLAVCREMGIDVVRRLTGGRAVLHDRELTYSIISPDNSFHFPDNILGTYKIISSCLVSGLNSIGLNALLTSPVKKAGRDSSSACFTSSSHYEITIDGKKLVGSAQRRGEGAFLQHGSILMEFDREKLEKVLHKTGGVDSVASISEYSRIDIVRLATSLVKGFEHGLGVSFSEGRLTDEEVALSQQCRNKRYSKQEWNFRRPSETK
jgi:lipoate-protein ligase A